jgi:alpha-tubulin suppressor-like RCC1 family protein
MLMLKSRQLFYYIFILLLPVFLQAQVFIPFGMWRAKKQLTVRCESGCYPTPTTPFTAALYYVPANYAATFSGISVSNPTAYDFCWGPTNAGGCAANAFGGGTIYPLTCSEGTDSIDGSSAADQASYVAPTTATTSTCNITDYAESRATTSFNIQSFNPILITSPVTTLAAPQNICVGQTQVINGTGGLGTRTWSVSSGGGSVSPTTGASTTYTAPGTAQTAQVQLIDPTTSMTALAYFNVISTISLSPTTTVETPVNATASLTSSDTTFTTYTKNLNIKANCGLANYTAGTSGGTSSVTPTAGIGNNVAINYTPASANSTTTITFTDSTPVTPQTATLTVNNIVPVDISATYGYHVCAKYTHTTYTAGTYKVKCWGSAANGRLGNGSTTNHFGDTATELGTGLTFVKDTGTTGADMMVKEISAGWTHTCAILSNDTVKCWGDNTSGALGINSTTSTTSPNTTVAGLVGTPKKIYAGYNRTCVVFSDDRLKCWGKNTNGELGQDNTTSYGSSGTNTVAAIPDYVIIGGAYLTVQKIVLSQNNTCVLASSAFAPGPSSVYCWGLANNAIGSCSTTGATTYCGELGTAVTSSQGDTAGEMTALTAVNVGLGGGESVIDITAGRKHFCTLIVTSPAVAGRMVCWGLNTNGQLGKDGNTTTATPGSVLSTTTATAVYSMTRSTCATLTGGNAKCWGRGTNGQLLQGNANSLGDNGGEMAALGNMNFGTGRTVKKFAGGFYFACAILDNDFVKCWGAANCGSTAAAGCLLRGTTTSTNYGDAAGEVGDSLPYVNH